MARLEDISCHPEEQSVSKDDTNAKLSLAVLISGRGSNLQSLIDACKDPNYPAQIKLVISNKADAYGLTRAEQAGIKTLTIDHKGFKTREEFDEAMHQQLIKENIDLVCLAGFMRILSPAFVQKWTNKMLNIHPSLLPAYKGTDTHERVLAAKDKVSGCTVHYVTAELDDGPIVLQKTVPVLENDTPETLAARVLEQEHKAYPEAVKLIAEQKRKGES